MQHFPISRVLFENMWTFTPIEFANLFETLNGTILKIITNETQNRLYWLASTSTAISLYRHFACRYRY